MIVEITCGLMFGSLALVADGIHMSTHAIAFFITAFAYSYSRKHANSPSYVFGTGKVGELAAYTSALILIGISLYILYDGINRFVYPEDIIFEKALPVAFVGLSVNIASGFILGSISYNMTTLHIHAILNFMKVTNFLIRIKTKAIFNIAPMHMGMATVTLMATMWKYSNMTSKTSDWIPTPL